MTFQRANLLLLLSAIALASACSKPAPDPTGLERRMTIEQAVEILGSPDTIKPAGEKKLIYIYRRPSELITVFFIDGRIKSIEHIRSTQNVVH